MSVKAFFLSSLLLGTAPVALIGAACPTYAADKATIRGVVEIQGKADLPPEARVTVTLEDVSLADAPSVTLSKTVFAPVTPNGLAYVLSYDPKALQAGHRYTLRSEIRAGDRLLYLTKSADLDTGKVPEQTHLMVEPVTAQLPDAVVGNWKIDRIGGSATDPTVPAFITLRADGFLSGTGGCNRMMGRVTVTDQAFKFGPLAGTRMACFGNRMMQEDAVFAATPKVATWRLESGALLLADAQGKTVLTLSPVKTGAPVHSSGSAHIKNRKSQ